MTDAGRGSDRRADVVFVSHEATLTGAPVGLIQLVRWLRAHTDLEIEVVLLTGGALVGAFSTVARVRALEDVLAGPPPKVLFLNSCFSAEVLLASRWEGSYVIARVPELGVAFDDVLPAATRATLLGRADRIIAVAECVRRRLIAHHQVEERRVSVVHGVIPDEEPGVSAEAVAAARLEAGLPPVAAVVGAVGTRSWRKGTDLFLQLAADLRRRRPEAAIHFLWVGDHDRSWQFARLSQDVERAGLSDRVHLLPDTLEPTPFQHLMDVFALTSREDPFPRVALEAAALGRPVVAFDSGGVEELLTRADSNVVPYADVGAMADRVLAWLDDPAAAAVVGHRLADVVRSEFTLSVGAPKVLAEIQRGLVA